MPKIYDVVATVGEYEKDGKVQYRNRNVGAVVDGGNGPFLSLEGWVNYGALKKTADGRVNLALFEPSEKGDNQPPPDYDKTNDIPY